MLEFLIKARWTSTLYTTCLMWQLIPSLQQCFPTFRGEKHPLREGDLGGLLVSPWVQRAVIVATTPICYHVSFSFHLSLFAFCFCLISSSSANDMATEHHPTLRRHVSDCLWSLYWAEGRFLVGEWGTHCLTVCPALASSLARGACFPLKENKSLNENDKLRAEDVFLATAKAPVPVLAVTLP